MEILRHKLLLFVLFLFVACSSRKAILSKDELVKYINEKNSGLKQEQVVNGIKISVSYEPASLLIAKELEAGRAMDSVLFHSLEKKYDNSYYFFLKFSKDGKEAIRQLGNFKRYSDMLQVLAFDMHQFVNLTTPQRDTLELSDYYFDQTYGMSDGNSLLLSFDKSKIQRVSQVQVNIGECGFGTGMLKFSFDKEEIDRVPKLDYNRL
jgi:hypothetical protein